MDTYYSDLARHTLSAAEAEIVKAQNYLRKAGAGNYLTRRVVRLLNLARKLQDDIHVFALSEADKE